jgi:hypothetical protein
MAKGIPHPLISGADEARGPGVSGVALILGGVREGGN